MQRFRVFNFRTLTITKNFLLTKILHITVTNRSMSTVIIQHKTDFLKSQQSLPSASGRMIQHAARLSKSYIRTSHLLNQLYHHHHVTHTHMYSGTPLTRTPLGPTQSVLIRGVSLIQGLFTRVEPCLAAPEIRTSTVTRTLCGQSRKYLTYIK